MRTRPLDEAQLAKKRHIAAKLLVRPGQHVLDIGCGWGGLALYLARVCGARVTGVTLSEEQHKVACARVAKEGLADKVDIRLMDYRDVKGSFDRVVSVGMFEHVGKGDYAAFFDRIRDALPEDGVALLHTIGCGDEPGPTNPWVTKYIFPGGYLPALSDMTPVIEKSDLITTDIETLRLHYAYTLKNWRQRFLSKRDEMAKLYDERFCRMWEFFLAASEAAFRFDRTLVFQVQMAKHENTVPITRDYIAKARRGIAQDRKEPAAARARRTAGLKPDRQCRRCQRHWVLRPPRSRRQCRAGRSKPPPPRRPEAELAISLAVLRAASGCRNAGSNARA